MSRVLATTLGCCLLWSANCAELRAENWPRWRGPTGNMISTETGIATQWGPDRNVAWRTTLPGPAGSTPVVWGDRIFLTTLIGSEDGAELAVACLSTSGEKLWQQTVGGGNQWARVDKGNSASASPVTDGKHVWYFFGTGMLGCFDIDGNERWKFDVQDRYGKIDIQFGMSSTPVLDGDDLYLQLMHGTMRGSYTVLKVVKLDARTGDEIWAVDRKPEPGVTPAEMFETKHSYASPFLYDDAGQRFLVTHGADATVGYRLDDGEELWRLGGLNGPSEFNPGNFDPTFRFVATPTAAEQSIVVPTAKRGPMVALKVTPDLHGRIERPSGQVRWFHDRTPDVACPLIVDGLVYCVDAGSGQVFCLELETGKQLYYERGHGGVHYASPLYADGHVYVTAMDGNVNVIKSGRAYEIVSSNTFGEKMTASPIVSDGTLYLRTYEALYAIRNAGQ